MKASIAEDKKQQKRFLQFRKSLYQGGRRYVDNNYFMLKELFAGKLHVLEEIVMYPVNIEADDGQILCQGVLAYARALPEYMQLCFFEALPGQQAAAQLLVETAAELGKKHGCKRLVIGLSGHVNYGLGLLASHYEEVNSFSSPGNPEEYNRYFRAMHCDEILLNSYITHALDDRLDRYRAIINKLERTYEFQTFDKKRFAYFSKLYTDLNNECFAGHRYYYQRRQIDDQEMLKELFLFMKEDSLVFAFRDGEPAGFIMWYPDYNELAKRGELFGAKHFFRNLFQNRRIKTAKVMEYGVLERYRGSGLPLALMQQVFRILAGYGCERIETSWILDENADSNSFCKAFCDEAYKEYVVYEKEIG